MPFQLSTRIIQIVCQRPLSPPLGSSPQSHLVPICATTQLQHDTLLEQSPYVCYRSDVCHNVTNCKNSRLALLLQYASPDSHHTVITYAYASIPLCVTSLCFPPTISHLCYSNKLQPPNTFFTNTWAPLPKQRSSSQVVHVFAHLPNIRLTSTYRCRPSHKHTNLCHSFPK